MAADYNALLASGGRAFHNGGGTIRYSFLGSTVPGYYQKIDTNGDGTADSWLIEGAAGSASRHLLPFGANVQMTAAEQALAGRAIDAWNAVANVHLAPGTLAPPAATTGTAVTGSGALMGGLGGATGYGETVLPRADDGSVYVDFTPVFSAGLTFFGTTYRGAWVNTNGSISFASALSTYTPQGISGSTVPMIAPFWADIDTRMNGGDADSGPVVVDLDAGTGIVSITWSQVGYFSYGADRLNSFQLQLYDRTGGDFDIVFRYGDISWTAGNASGGANGLGGTAARAGYSAGNGADFLELPQSGDQAAMLALETTAGNTGTTGLYVYRVLNGQPAVGDITFGAGNFGGATQGFVAATNPVLGTASADGDVWIDRDAAGQSAAIYGDRGWQDYVREIGRALGLGTIADPNDPANTSQYTALSANAQPGANGSAPVTPMLYDMQAIQALYGANLATNTGDTTYFGAGGLYEIGDGGKLANGQTLIATIWDAGGNDTFDLSRQTAAMTIDLQPGHYSSVGMANNIAVMTPVSANGAVVDLIENAIGGSGDDTILGNAGNNILLGQGGNDRIAGMGGRDVIDGGAGVDTLVLAGGASEYAVTRVAGQLLLDRAGERVLANAFETIEFAGRPVGAATVNAGATEFDGLRYIAGQADLIRALGADATAGLRHFLSAGFIEGRATARFDPWAYLASNADLIRAYGPDTLAAERHYITFGLREGRALTSFDGLAYLAVNRDVALAVGADADAAARHYVAFGLREGRTTGGFDALRYVASSPDLVRAIGTDSQAAIRHWITFGMTEGRPTTSFDPLRYVASHPDLIRSLGADATAGTRHWIDYGMAEGRSATSFDPTAYMAANRDLARAFAGDATAAERHYIEHGLAEGRTTGGFDAVAYLLSNADLAKAGLTTAQATAQWVEHGAGEGRAGDAAYGREQTNHALAVNGAVADTLGTSGDRDWFGLNLAAGQHVQIRMQTTGFAPTVALADEHGAQIASAFSVQGASTAIDFTADHAATYYVSALATFGAPGDYLVAVQAV